MGRGEEEDELTVSLQGHCMSQRQGTALLMCTVVCGRKLHRKLWKGLGSAAPAPCKSVGKVWAGHILITPNCGFKDSPGHLPGMAETPPSHTSRQGLFPKGVLSSLPFPSRGPEAGRDLWRPSSPGLKQGDCQ